MRVAVRLTAVAVLVLAAVLTATIVDAQAPAVAPAAPPGTGELPTDSLGRDTPRGTVVGFMAAFGKGSDDVAPFFMNTTLRGRAASDLAHQLYVVLDRRLRVRLNELSDRPEGSLKNPLKPKQDIVGTIATANGPLDVVVERVDRNGIPVWLFSRTTLELIPEVHSEVDLVRLDRHLPRFLVTPRLAGLRLIHWLVFFLVGPSSYVLLGALGRLFGCILTFVPRRAAGRAPRDLLPGPVRLLLQAVGIHWLLANLDLPLAERRFWSATAAMLATSAAVWLLLWLTAGGERYISRRVEGSGAGESAAMLRLVRRVVDVLVVTGGGLVAIYYFGFDPTAALAGLGIGGLAIALAAQKTLENVIGGMSIIFDKAVRVGDFMKLGETCGTVVYIGLRSTRIRTLDRTILSVPNGQIANVNVETLSVRDKFWFHHVIPLRYGTTSDQMRATVEHIQKLLLAYPGVDPASVRVCFFRLGESSLDIEVVAYLIASDWERFIKAQQDLLLQVMEIVEGAGTAIALPSQTLQLTDMRTVTSGVRMAGNVRAGQLATARERQETA